MNQYRIQVSAGQGPAEVRRFVARLAARLEALCEAGGLLALGVVVHGDEGAPSSVEILAAGDAPGLLAGEIGTHALVERSSRRGKEARKRWFAGVAVHPLEEAGAGAPIDARDLEITAMKASGPGGQHVNKASTAVRVLHRPSGIAVRVSDERSQRANVKRAVERLTERLADREAALRADGEASLRLAHYRFERGAPVRTYRIGRRGALETSDQGAG